MEIPHEEWIRIQSEVTTRMIGNIKYYITPISKVLSKDKDYGELEGSGSYIGIENKKYIITNAHVAKTMITYPLTHQFYESDLIIQWTHKPLIIEKPVDIALCQIDEETWNMCEHKSLPIPYNRFAKEHSPVQKELLFLAGNSGERSNFCFGHLLTKVTPYMTQECDFPYDEKRADPKYHFSLFYNPDLATCVGENSHLPLPPGLSGSLVWNTKWVEYSNQGKEWNPEFAEVTGIIWGWPSTNACLLATKVEYLGLDDLVNNK